MKHTRGDQVGHGRDQFWVILVVRVQHHHNVSAQAERVLVTRFLISSITPVSFMPEDMPDTKRFRHLYRFILAVVVYEDHIIHNSEVNFTVGFLQRLCCIVSRKHHHHFLSLYHTQCLESEKYKTLTKGANKRNVTMRRSACERMISLIKPPVFYCSLKTAAT